MSGDPRVNAVTGGYNYAQSITKVKQDLMKEHKCTDDQACIIMNIASLNSYNYDLAINAVINEGATPILYNERHSGDGTYIYTRAYVTKTGKLIGNILDNCMFSYPQNCYKYGGFK